MSINYQTPEERAKEHADFLRRVAYRREHEQAALAAAQQNLRQPGPPMEHDFYWNQVADARLAAHAASLAQAKPDIPTLDSIFRANRAEQEAAAIISLQERAAAPDALTFDLAHLPPKDALRRLATWQRFNGPDVPMPPDFAL